MAYDYGRFDERLKPLLLRPQIEVKTRSNE